MMDLSNRAMLAQLTITQWSARKLDKRATAETLDANAAQSDAGRFSKNLLAGQDAQLKQLSQIATTARTEHYTLTLPWSDDGARILTAAAFRGYQQTMTEHRGAFDAAADAFVRDIYPHARDSARFALGKLFSEADYPTIDKVRRKFSFEFALSPLPSSSDFRVSLTDVDIQAVQQDYEARYRERTDAAMADLWRRLYEPIAHIAKTLPAYHGGDIKRFNDSLIGNLSDIVRLLPDLNLTGDADLERLAREAEFSLLQYSPQRLREDPACAQDAASSAASLARTMAAYMGETAIDLPEARPQPGASIVDLFRKSA